MWIVRYALDKPYSIAAFALLIFLSGVLSYNRLAVNVLPSVNIPAVKIIWTYNGLNAKEMASKITTFSEVSIMNNVDNIKEVSSQTLNGIAVIRVSFQSDVDISNAMSQITSVSQTILRHLPAGTTPPLISQYNQYRQILPIFVLLTVFLVAVIFTQLVRDFFPRVDAGLMRFYVREEHGLRVEDTTNTFAQIQRNIRNIVPTSYPL